MAVKQVDMAEETRLHRLVVDSTGRRQVDLMRRCGGVTRSTGSDWEDAWKEAESMERAESALEMPPAGARASGPSVPLDPASLLRRQRSLLDALAARSLDRWSVTVRSFRQRRRVICGRGEDYRIVTGRDVLLLRVRVAPGEKEIELGEGRLPGEVFNRDGLLQRLEAVLDNRRRAKPLGEVESLPVVLAAGDGGIIWHELMGHSLEGDHVLAGESPITRDDLGREIMSRAVTLTARHGSDPFLSLRQRDDEGEICRHPRLIENGVLRRFICDRRSGARLGVPERGHARREGFDRRLMPRMFALYLEPGSHRADEIIASVRRGVYAGEFGRGRVLFRKGRFAFHLPAAVLIENGRLGRPLGAVTVQGDLDRAFQAVSMVGDDFRLDRGVSFCHKRGQVLHVRVGQPTVRVDGLEVGPGGG